LTAADLSPIVDQRLEAAVQRRSDRPRGTGAIQATDEEMARYARALGHPVRVAILRRLIERGECVCGDIVQDLPLAQSTVSQHLKVLREAGLLRGEIDGPRVCYCADEGGIARFHALVQEYVGTSVTKNARRGSRP
jgi:ArsR family transcriptional regulator